MMQKLLKFIPVQYLLLFFLIHIAQGTTPIVSDKEIAGNESSETEKKKEEVNVPKYRAYEFSESELQIIGVLKKNRAEKKVKAFDVNPRISEAINQELENIFKQGSKKEIGMSLDTLQSYLGGVCFIIRGESMSNLLKQLNQNERLQKEIGDSTNLMTAFGLSHTTKTDKIYCILYFCKYPIEYGISMVSGPPTPPTGGGPPDSVFLKHEEINGKCNAEYIKYCLYEARGLPFHIEKEDLPTGEIQTVENGGFTISISYNSNNNEVKHLAIFARNNLSEVYSLSDIIRW
jgi:hypothetical protein